MRLLLPLLAFTALIATEVPSRGVDRPNVLLIISDDQAWTDYGFMGHPHIKTPHLDKLAGEGLTFTRGYVPSSLCCPSLASIVTGKYPHQHRVTSNDPPIPAGTAKNKAFSEGREIYNRYMDAERTLPRVFVQNGYMALQTGKWWQGDYTRGGFTHGMTKGARHGDEGLDIGRRTMKPVFDFISTARKESKPFFVWYAPMLPHDPHTPPQRILEKYRDKTPSIHIARYWAMVEWFDETCGELLAFLDKEKLSENTIVAYVTDNGWIQSPDKPAYAPRSKQSQYDGGLRTPIIIRWPGKIAPRKSDTAVSSLDLFPTLINACGFKAGEGLPGIDLRDEAALAARKAVFGECFSHNSRDLANPAASLRWRWVIEGDWKLILPHPANESGGPELYNLKADPVEEKNLAGSENERVVRMTAVLDGWWKP